MALKPQDGGFLNSLAITIPNSIKKDLVSFTETYLKNKYGKYQQIWKYQGAKGNIFSSIHIKEVAKLKWQMIFGCHDNNVYSINIKNFQPSLHWKSELTSPVYGTPCSLTDKLLLAVSNNGILSILDADTGNIISEYRLPNESFSTPVVYNDYIFIGCRNDNIYALKYVLNFNLS